MNDALRSTLTELEQVLASEREALRKLDLEGVQRASTCKAELERKLREHAPLKPLEGEDRAILLRIRAAAQANQLLIVHARACIRGALALATGQVTEPYSQHPPSPPGPLRINLRG